MQKLGEDKAVKSAEDKAVKPAETKSTEWIKYIGYSEYRYVSDSSAWPKTTFKRDEPVEVGATLAKALLAQPDKFVKADKARQ